MSNITLADDNGDTMALRDLDGFNLPRFQVPEEDWRSMPTWTARDDDVMLIAYPKAGTHWLWEIISMIMSGSEEYKPHKAFCMMEAITKESYDGITSPRIMNSHLYPKHLPQEVFKRKNKIIMINRNPKDLAVSYYNFHFNLEKFYQYHGEWKNYLPRFIEGKVDYGKFFDYMKVWQTFMEDNPDYPIHVVHYEDLIEKGHEELKKISKFLQCRTDDAFLRTVEERCNFKSMKEVKEVKDSERFKHLWRNEQPKIYRKGKVGDWKNWFTVAQNEMIDAVIKKESINSVFKFRYELA